MTSDGARHTHAARAADAGGTTDEHVSSSILEMMVTGRGDSQVGIAASASQGNGGADERG